MKQRNSRLYITALMMSYVLSSSSFSVLAQTDTINITTQYEEALVQYQQGELVTASLHLKNLLQSDPSYLSAHILLGKIYLEQGDAAGAEKELTIAKNLGADSSLIIVPLAKAYLLLDKYQELLSTFTGVGYTGDIKRELLLLRGQAFLQTSQLESAEQTFQEVLAFDDKSIDAILGVATVWSLRGDYQAAAEQASLALKYAQDNVQAWYFSGSMQHALGQLQQALSSYGKAIELAPAHLAARMARAGLYLDMKDHVRALADLSFLRTEYPRDPRVAYLYAVALGQSGDLTASHQAMQEAGTLIDGLDEKVLAKHGPSLLLAGLVNYSLDQWEKAYAHLSRYVERYPSQVGARKLLGSILLSRGEYNKALSMLEPALVNSPSDYRLLTLIGTAYVQAGKHFKAGEILERAIALAPDAPEASIQNALNKLATGKDGLAMEELTGVFSKNNQVSQAGLILAVMQYKRQDFEAARNTTTQIVQHEPDNLTALNLLASSQMALNQLAEARTGFEKAVALSPDYLPARINLAKLDLLEAKPDEALSRLLAIHEQHPKHIQTMTELARVAEIRQQPQAAIRWLEKARAEDDQSVTVNSYLVDVYLRNNQAEQALKIAKDAEARVPDNLQILDAVGRSYMANRQPGRAKQLYARMADMAGFDTPWLYLIAQRQQALGDLGKAIWSLYKAVQGNEEFLPARIMLVEAQLQARRLEDADESISKLREKYPRQPIGFRLQGDLELQHGQAHKAITQYKISLDMEPNPATAIALYRAYLAAAKEAAALNFLLGWVKAHPDEITTRLALAEEYYRTAKLEQAKIHYEQVLQVLPNDPALLNNLAYLYFKTGDSRALELARKAQQLAPESATVSDTLGWLLVQADQTEQGLHHLRSAHSRDSANPEIRYHIAVALQRLGRGDEARHELEQALAANTPFDGVDDARELLRQLSD